jgi:MYXO-CTERM domain-containing protein
MKMRAATWLLTAATTTAGFLCFLESAEAQSRNLEACSNINVEAGAECDVIPPTANCDIACEDFSVQAACAAELKVDCDAMCQFQASVDCNVDCRADCSAECTGTPGEFDCFAYCRGSCSGECSGKCEAGEKGANCRASCEATCTGECNAGCNITPPMIDCNARCEASCQGSCKAQANLDCQADCQADGYVRCEADVRGGCKADCMTQQGALFCDGYYVDTGDNLQMCVEALQSLLEAEVNYMGEYNGECANGKCTASAKASASCSALPGSGPANASSYGLVLLGLALYRVRRRRN